MYPVDSDTSTTRQKKLEEELAEQDKAEKQIGEELDAIINEIPRVKINLFDFTSVDQNIMLLNDSTKQLTTILQISSSLSNKINLQIQELDTARSRVLECQKRVQDLLDLQLCSDGVQKALKIENYEQAAVHIHRFLAMDQQVLKQTADEMAQDCTTVTQSLKLLREATDMLKNKILFHFQEAASVNDTNSVKQFFKLFPLLNMREDGLQQFSNYLRKMLRNSVNDKLDMIKSSNVKERKNMTVFADVITYLFEGIAKIITDHKPLIETHYESGKLIKIISALQKECDSLSESILKAFRIQRDMNSRVHMIHEFLRSGSSKTEHIDPKDIDMLLNEEDLEGELRDSEKQLVQSELDNLISFSNLSKNMQILIGDYLLLERYYMEQSIRKAMQMDIADKDALISNMIDDIFFIVKKCIRRAYSSANIDAACAVVNNACTILETDVCNTLRQQLRQGYSAGYLDLTQAYNVMIQGRLQQVDSEQTRVLFLLYLNNCDVCGDYSNTLLSNLTEEMKCSSDNETAKLNSCLSGFSSVITAFTAVREYGLLQLKNSVVKPRVVPWVDNFLSISHNLNSEEFSNYEANEPFIRELIFNLETLLSEFKSSLTPANYDSFVLIIADEVILQLEKDILKSEFNRMGGLVLDKEIRTLISYMSNATSWSVREKFARLIQMSLLLNLEKVSEVLEYSGSDACSFTWKLTPKEIKNVLLLRKDFRSDEIKRLKI